MARGREGGGGVGGQAGVERPRAEGVGLHGSLGLGAAVLEPDLDLENIVIDGLGGGGKKRSRVNCQMKVDGEVGDCDLCLCKPQVLGQGCSVLDTEVTPLSGRKKLFRGQELPQEQEQEQE